MNQDTDSENEVDDAREDGKRSAKAVQPSKKSQHVEEEGSSEQLDAEGRFRPRFVVDFPKGPKLDELVRAFERGDFNTVRKEAPKLAREAEDPKVRAAFEELSKRIKPDPLLKTFLWASIGLALFLVLWSYW